MALRALSVCSGIGGLDLGRRLGCPDGEVVCYVERDCYAAATLVARMEEKVLDQAPIWSDLATFPSDLLFGFVDGLFGGIPCQPYSLAGQKRGAEDSRDLWPETVSVICDLGLRWAFLENVDGLFSHEHGLRRMLWDFTKMGWNAEWGVFSNEMLGAPH